jgi:sugar lactone lactonase YvrE
LARGERIGVLMIFTSSVWKTSRRDRRTWRPGHGSGTGRLQAAPPSPGCGLLPESPHNLAWGDEDARTLYITALTSIYRIRLGFPGVRPH